MNKIVSLILLILGFSVFNPEEILVDNSIFRIDFQYVIFRIIRGTDLHQPNPRRTELLANIREKINEILYREFSAQDVKEAWDINYALVQIINRSPDVNVNNIIIPILEVTTKLASHNLEEFRENTKRVKSLFFIIYPDYGSNLEREILEFVRLADELSDGKAEEFRMNLQTIEFSLASKLKNANISIAQYLNKLTKFARDYSNDIGEEFRKNAIWVGTSCIERIKAIGVENVKFVLDNLLELATRDVNQGSYIDSGLFRRNIRMIGDGIKEIIINKIMMDLRDEVQNLEETIGSILQVSFSIADSSLIRFYHNNKSISFFIKTLIDKSIDPDRVLIPSLRIARDSTPNALGFQMNLGDREGIAWLINKLSSKGATSEKIEEIILTKVKDAAQEAGGDDREFRRLLIGIVEDYR